MQSVRQLASDRLEFFPPAAKDIRSKIAATFSAFDLSEYLALLEESDGVGELFVDGADRFVHNMLLFSAEEALAVSDREFQGQYLVIGAPGVDGIRYVLQPSRPEVFAYGAFDEDLSKVASSVYGLLQRWEANELRL